MGEWTLANVERFARVQEQMRQAGIAVGVIAYGHRLGQIEMRRGNFESARRFFAETLELRRLTGADRLGHYHSSTFENLQDLAEACRLQGDERAALAYADEVRAAAAHIDDNAPSDGAQLSRP
jgi:hypothetical protein